MEKLVERRRQRTMEGDEIRAKMERGGRERDAERKWMLE